MGSVFLLDFLRILGTWSLWKFITLIGPLAEVWLWLKCFPGKLYRKGVHAEPSETVKEAVLMKELLAFCRCVFSEWIFTSWLSFRSWFSSRRDFFFLSFSPPSFLPFLLCWQGSHPAGVPLFSLLEKVSMLSRVRQWRKQCLWKNLFFYFYY